MLWIKRMIYVSHWPDRVGAFFVSFFPFNKMIDSLWQCVDPHTFAVVQLNARLAMRSNRNFYLLLMLRNVTMTARAVLCYRVMWLATIGVTWEAAIDGYTWMDYRLIKNTTQKTLVLTGLVVTGVFVIDISDGNKLRNTFIGTTH